MAHVACPGRAADITVSWPGGLVETWDGLTPGELHLLREGDSRKRPDAAPKTDREGHGRLER